METHDNSDPSVLNLGPRLRRIKSTSVAEDIVTEAEKQRRAQPDKPIHKPKDSLLSWSSGFTNFEGLVTWAFLILSLGGFRLFLENINKYGIRVDPALWRTTITYNLNLQEGECPTIALLLVANAVICLTWFAEVCLSKKWGSPYIWYSVHFANITTVLACPVIVIHTKSEYIGPGKATLICGMSLILMLKLWSYIQVNYWCRLHLRQHIEGKKKHQTKSPSLADQAKPTNALRTKSYSNEVIVQYPDNLTLGDIYYFWFAPTLCYELNFPKMQRIRKLFLLRRVVEVIVGTNIVLALIQQWIIPSAVNSLIPFSNMDVSRATERLLKLAIPNHLIWLTWFYLIFHSFLNTMGEILCFADRNFYMDWWNAKDILDFWKNWNLPVHRWCVRHMFKPMLRNKYPLVLAQVIVFLFSAIFHEYLISVPLRVFKAYAFLGMAMQIPLIFISKFLNSKVGHRAGNVTVWVSLIIGQPLAIMMYYHDFVAEHYGEELISYYGQLSNINITRV